MMLLLLNLLLIVAKQFLAYDIENKIYYSSDEIRKIKFTINANDKKTIDIVGGDATNATPQALSTYIYTTQNIHDVIDLSDSKHLENYFKNIVNDTYCDAIINQNHANKGEIIKQCDKKTFCGIQPAKGPTTINEEDIINKIYCGHINNESLYVYFIGNAELTNVSLNFEELIFYDENKVINCGDDLINILYTNVYSENCSNEKITELTLKNCNGQKKCTLSFNNSSIGSCSNKNFFVQISYKCVLACTHNVINEQCHVIDNKKYSTCRYGYKKKSNNDNICERLEMCFGNQCGLNQYCDTSNHKCACFDNVPERDTSSCIYNNFCSKLNCPKDSECITDDDKKFPECKCKDDKILYKNNCYTEDELKTALQNNPSVVDNIYLDHLFEKSVIDYRFISLRCPEKHTIEVIQATSTCYGINFENTKSRYFSDFLRSKCDGKQSCSLLSEIQETHSPPINATCAGETGNVYHYQYMCKAILNSTNSLIPNTLTSSSKNSRVALFSSSLNSKLICEGGKIDIRYAKLFSGETCTDVILTTQLKEYCDNLTECDIGLIYQFDRYCVNGSLLYVSYNCTPLVSSCTENFSIIGNKHKNVCVCRNPYTLGSNNTCQLKTQEENKCGNNESYKQLQSSQGICECDSNYTNINGMCVSKECDLRCPSNKICKKDTSNEKTCVCHDKSEFDGIQCICESNYIMKNGTCEMEDLCLTKKNTCTGNNEVCNYKSEEKTIECLCKEHYERVDGKCVMIDYCKNVTCKKNERCEVKSHRGECICDGEFNTVNEKCVYKNKCELNNGGCPTDSECVYHEDKAHECVCKKKGFQIEDNICVAIDKCSSNTLCPENSICVNRLNNDPLCLCTFNYFQKDGQCLIRNKCLQENGGCDRNAICRMDGENVECLCKYRYKKEADSSNKCIPDVNKEDYVFNFKPTDSPIIIFGNCGLLHFNTEKKQLIWKINHNNEIFIFDYVYPTTDEMNATIKNEEFSSIVFLKKTENSTIIYDDFHLNHSNCSYSHLFFYMKDENMMYVS